VGWNGSVTWIGRKCARCRFRDLASVPQARNLREKVGGGTAMGGGPDIGEKIRDAEKPEAGRRGDWGF